MQTPAVGEGPVAFIDDEGRQLSIPLSAIYFEDGAVRSHVSASDSLTNWLNYLVARGQLVPGPTPSADQAMTVTATTAGVTGNGITVDVREIGSAAVEITVTESHVYEGLTFDSHSEHFVETVLGSAEGLVRATAVTAADTDVPARGLVAQAKVGTDTDKATWEVKAPPAGGVSADLATLEARSLGSETGTMTILVDDVDLDAKTFTLNVKWQITVTVLPADLLDVAQPPLADLGFAVRVEPPGVGAPLHLPAPGQATLGGGAKAVPATDPKKASVTLLADA
jgi:hypothetical protein